MACYVCDGAKLKCSMGSQESALAVMHPVMPVRVKGKPVATMMDHKPFVNIKPFGQCRSLANPTVAAATSANNGRLQPMPCIPNTTSPWMGTKMSALMKSQQALLDSSKLICMWAGMIEITNPGQDTFKEGGTTLKPKVDAVKSEEKAKNLAVVAGSGEESENRAALTIKDFAEVLKGIENDKKCYESARHYAAYHLDYWELTKLAMRYVDETDDEKKGKEKDNDPNLMPSRYMLLYGADDDKLRGNGNIDKHHDNFEGLPEHEISVANLRNALKILGHEVADSGLFDKPLLDVFLRFLNRFNPVELKYTYEDRNDEEKPLEKVADKYGAATWKFFEDNKDDNNNGIDHSEVTEKFNADYGNELIREKGGEPHDYRSSICYHYPWVPFRMVVDMGEDYKEDEETTYKIYDNANGKLLAEDILEKKNEIYVIELLVPDTTDVAVFVNGKRMCLVEPPKPEIVDPSQIEKVTWTFGEKYTPLIGVVDEDYKSKYYGDLSLHVETKEGNDGKIVAFGLKNEAGETINLHGTVSNNKIVFEKVFKKYM